MSTTTTSRAGRLARLVPAVAAALALSACAGSHPGVAAKVGDVTFTRADLDKVTAAQCALAGSQGSTGSATSRATTAQTTLALVVQAEQGIRYAETHDVEVDPAQVRSARTAFAQQLSGSGLTRGQRQDLLEVSTTVTKGQLVDQAVGAKKLGLPAQSSADQQALQAGSQVVGAWAARSGPRVTLDPRYNIGVKDGRLQLDDASVSVPVSSTGKQSAAQQPSQGYVTSLPVPQRCG